jgi:type I restriction enzyme S subunit
MNCNQAVAFARLQKSVADVEYVCWACQDRETMAPFLSLGVGGAIQNLSLAQVRDLELPLPPLPEQRRIAGILNELMQEVEKARKATEAQLAAARALPFSYVRQSLRDGAVSRRKLGDCLVETKKGVGSTWAGFRVVGATRSGIAPAKEKVGKSPERYKLADAGTVFYNPMRILLGSIALVDDGDEPGITSPDYVVFKGRDGIMSARWFYYWLRSQAGDAFIRSLARGAVRERILFPRLSGAEVALPSWQSQRVAADKMVGVRPTVDYLEQRLGTINKLPAALLRKAFGGDI